ncbi:hypothetical protein HDU76_005105, partial [Blyttiomyces sp. JEL0837]
MTDFSQLLTAHDIVFNSYKSTADYVDDEIIEDESLSLPPSSSNTPSSANPSTVTGTLSSSPSSNTHLDSQLQPSLQNNDTSMSSTVVDSIEDLEFISNPDIEMFSELDNDVELDHHQDEIESMNEDHDVEEFVVDMQDGSELELEPGMFSDPVDLDLLHVGVESSLEDFVMDEFVDEPVNDDNDNNDASHASQANNELDNNEDDLPFMFINQDNINDNDENENTVIDSLDHDAIVDNEVDEAMMNANTVEDHMVAEVGGNALDLEPVVAAGALGRGALRGLKKTTVKVGGSHVVGIRVGDVIRIEEKSRIVLIDEIKSALDNVDSVREAGELPVLDVLNRQANFW